jgi:hypothetical protein
MQMSSILLSQKGKLYGELNCILYGDFQRTHISFSLYSIVNASRMMFIAACIAGAQIARITKRNLDHHPRKILLPSLQV